MDNSPSAVDPSGPLPEVNNITRSVHVDPSDVDPSSPLLKNPCPNVIGKTEETRHNKTQQLNGSVDVNGFLVLPSQVESVKLIFERHPDIASGVHTKSPHLRTTYINVLLRLIETLCMSPEELSDDDLNEASAAISCAVKTGFKLDWLEKKLTELREQKNIVQSGEARLAEMEEELQNLNKECEELKALLEMEKAEVAAARIPLSFDDFL